MLENTFQHGGKQIKTRNLFFSRTPRPLLRNRGYFARFTISKTGNDAYLRRVGLVKSLSQLRVRLRRSHNRKAMRN